MQLEQKTYSNYNDRTFRMKKRVINAPHEMCIERAKLFTDSYIKTKGENPIIRPIIPALVWGANPTTRCPIKSCLFFIL